MVRVVLFDRYGQPLGELSENEVFGLVRHERINGEHSLTITTTRVLQQGWRILTCDSKGKWREHVVYGTDALHDSGERPFGDYYCVWSLQADLMGTRVSSMPGVINPVSAATALTHALAGTRRWQLGTVTNTATGGASMYDMDGWSAISVVVANWGGEVESTIEVGSNGVTARKADLYAKQGDQTPKRRYDFGADIKSVRRSIADGPLYCRITPRGKGEETDTGGYGRKVTISSVNDGKDYLENPAMTDLAKLPDGIGGWEYPTLEIENSDCETPAQLKAWAEGVLEEYTVPKITYDIDVLQLAQEGADLHGVSLGDAIDAVDRKFGDGIRVTGRVIEMTVNLLDEADAQITVGDLADDLASLLEGYGSQLDQLTGTVQAMNGGTLSTAEYLSRLLERLNTEINATGGYTYITQGAGIRTYDTEVSDPLDGTAEANAVVEIKGGTVRIADSKTAQGDWDWRTVFTAGHIAAELVTAAQITAGYISSPGGTFVNLDSNTAQMGATANAHTVFSQYGMEVFASGLDDVAFFGMSGGSAIARVGRETGGNVVATSAGAVDINKGETKVAHFGYGYVRDRDTLKQGSYGTVGTRTDQRGIGEWSFTVGQNNAATNYADYAEGLECIASGSPSTIREPSHAEGYASSATGATSHAEGVHATASGDRSHAQNYYTTASGQYSHAEGDQTTASGEASHAQGSETSASGYASHAAGEGTEARGVASTALGYYTRTSSNGSGPDGQTVCGRYNSVANNALFIVGKGAVNNRSNAFDVLDSGNIWCAGTLTQNSDRRLKEHIAYLGEDASEFMRNLKPALFEKDGERRLGFYAQDVAEADAWGTATVAAQGNDESLGFDPLTLEYTALIAPLTAYAQALEARIAELERRQA